MRGHAALHDMLKSNLGMAKMHRARIADVVVLWTVANLVCKLTVPGSLSHGSKS